MNASSESAWSLQVIRSTRASPPGSAAASEERRALYGAALQQFDELLSASAAAGYASRPLTLFYALSQATRAIVAVHGQQHQIGSHGLVEDRTATASDVLSRGVRRAARDDDALSALCAALNLPDPFGSTRAKIELGAAWAALPELNAYLPSWDHGWRPALRAFNKSGLDDAPHDMHLAVTSQMPGATDLDPLGNEAYPTIPAGADFEAASDRRFGLGDALLRVGNVRWGPRSETASAFEITCKAPDSHHRWLMPAAPGSDQPFTPLTAWWTVLFGLSIYARYTPGLWAGTLDLDRSDRAVPLHILLDAAMEDIPLLIADALVNGPIASD